ncbi:MAG TPA: DNA methyltransferase, partial [Usitatibacteraceae bacterium]|nr:DNA methyltransferase [Usitatibacteraceae bacterium]
HVGRFAFIAGYSTQKLAPEDPVNRRAAERMGRLHDALKAGGFTGHALEVLLVRLLFCLFAEDTGIFQPRKAFQDWVENRTAPDGSDLGPLLARFFQVLDTPESQRGHALDEQLAAFPYVNGKLFEERLPIADFDRATREALLDACALDWSQISPAIFGALFQSIMDAKARRNLGAHYTSERNILKLIRPLFLDELRAEFEKVKGNRNRLFEFHKKLRGLTFLDPACGCGNFLVVAYRELRLLELEVLRASRDTGGQRDLDTHWFTKLDVDQFHGIEIEEFPAQIAQLALWLTDHQMNLRVSEEFGLYFARIPLRTSPHIVHGNALRMDWDQVVPRERLSFILGNPPFVGKHYRSEEQRNDLIAAFDNLKAAGDLDFVAAWYIKALRMMQGTSIEVAFVSTNSITQGEQVPVLWPELFRLGAHIRFAHRTFQWNNEARGVAAVHCVIIGLTRQQPAACRLFEYENLRGEPRETQPAQISPYLTPGSPLVIGKRQQPLIPGLPVMRCGNKPSDGGHLLLTREERDALLAEEPAAAKYIRRFVGSEEFINDIERYCLWLQDAEPGELRAMPAVMRRVEAVRNFRSRSTAAPTRKAAQTPTRFFFVSQPETTYLLVPEVSSERRAYIPIGRSTPDLISSNKIYVVPSDSLELFGTLQSTMHMAWMRITAGRLKSDYQYSATMVYNTFPWPVDATDAQRAAIEAAAQGVLDARAQFPDASLADLYDPLTMPPALVKAHQALDRAVDAAYVPSGGKKSWASDAERVAFLFELYQRLTSLLPGAGPARKAGRPRAAGSASRL